MELNLSLPLIFSTWASAYLLLCFLASLTLLGVHLAAVTPGLILNPFYLKVEAFLKTLDNKTTKKGEANPYMMVKGLVLYAINLFVLVACISLTFLTWNFMYLMGLWVLTSFVFLKKTFSSIGKFFFACHKCMPTFYIAFPLGFTGLYLGFMSDPIYFCMIPAGIVTVAIVSTMNTAFKAWIKKQSGGNQSGGGVTAQMLTPFNQRLAGVERKLNSLDQALKNSVQQVHTVKK
ncbi:MAG: hypothetical protein AAFO96_03670 [Bacteroidota bacterium]